MPRVMQRSYRVKSWTLSNGPSPNVPRSRGAARLRASGSGCGMMPVGGSTTYDVWRKARRAKSLRNVLVDRKSTRLNSSHSQISYAVFCLKKKKRKIIDIPHDTLH